MTSREKLAILIHRRQDEAVAATVAATPEIDWSRVPVERRSEYLAAISDLLLRTKRARVRAILAALLHGGFIAAWGIRRIGLPIVGTPSPVQQVRFAEALPSDPEEVAAYWAKRAQLSSVEVEAIIGTIGRALANNVEEEYRSVVTQRALELFERAVREEVPYKEFTTLFRETMPGISKHEIETLYRTGLQKVYGQRQLLEIRGLKSLVPFVQYLIIDDDRVRDNHEAMKNYIAASDDEIWDEWQPPNGWNCRCVLSPISYIEAERLGIARRANGVTYLTKGRRPFGEPPNVQPDEGFRRAA